MSSYKDYGYHNTQPDHTQHYIWQPLISLMEPTSVILDLGCGNGAFANHLIAKGFNAFGTDASEKGIFQANSVNPGHFFCARPIFR